MATKYLLQTLEGETLETVSKKQTAIKKAGQQGLLAFQVVTDSGNVVFERRPVDVTTVVEEQPSAIPAENSVAESLPVLEDEAVEAAEPLFYEFLDFPGNYSIVTAPGAVQIAEAAGVPAKVEMFKGKLTRRVHFGGPDMDLTSRTVSYIQQAVADAHEDLAAWQKEHRAERKGLTDMQKYLQHREVLSNRLERAAKRAGKDGV